MIASLGAPVGRELLFSTNGRTALAGWEGVEGGFGFVAEGAGFFGLFAQAFYDVGGGFADELLVREAGFVGGEDELFLPEKFAEVFGGVRSDIPVTIIPGMGHSDMITKAEAIAAVVNTFPNR